MCRWADRWTVVGGRADVGGQAGDRVDQRDKLRSESGAAAGLGSVQSRDRRGPGRELRRWPEGHLGHSHQGSLRPTCALSTVVWVDPRPSSPSPGRC